MTLAGLEYTLPYIMSIGPDRIQTHAQTLTDRLTAELPRLGYQLMTPAEAQSPSVFNDMADVERLLAALPRAS